MLQPLIQISRKQAFYYASFFVLYEFLTYIANDMIMPSMIQVVTSFHAPESAIATSLTAYVLGGASLQVLLGPLSDRFGRRPVMLFGAMFFFLCTLFIACSLSIEQFLFARFLQGMGLCFVSVIGYATLQEIFAEKDAVRLIAIMANVSILAPLLGPLLGAIFINYFNWRIIFVLIGGFALISLWGLWQFMPESIGQVKVDGEEIKATPLSTGVIFKNYTSLLLNPCVLLGSFALGLLTLPCLLWIAISPIILIKQGQLSVLQYGLWQIPLFGANIVGNWFLQILTNRNSLKQILLWGSVIVGISLFMVGSLPLLINPGFIWLMPGLICYFFAMGVTAAPLNRLVLFSTPVSKGTTSAFISMMIMVLSGLGIELGNFLFLDHGQSNTSYGLFCVGIAIGYLLFLMKTYYYLVSDLSS